MNTKNPTSNPTMKPTEDPTLSPSISPSESIPIIVRPITDNPTMDGAVPITFDTTQIGQADNGKNTNDFDHILPFNVENYLIVIILSIILLCTCCVFLLVFIAIQTKKKSLRKSKRMTTTPKETEMVPKAIHLHQAVASQSIAERVILHSPSYTAQHSMEPNSIRIKSYSQMSAMTPNGVLDILDDTFVEGNVQNMHVENEENDGDEENYDDDLYQKKTNVVITPTKGTDDGADHNDLYSSGKSTMTPE